MSTSTTPPSAPARRLGKRAAVAPDSDDELEEKRISIPHPSDVLRRLAMVTTRILAPKTRVLSPEDTHKTMAGTMAWIEHPGGEKVIMASFHGNALSMRPLAGAPSDEVHADLEVGDCWNADERDALVRLVRILHLNLKRPIVVLYVTFRAPPPAGLDRRTVRPRIDVFEILQRAFGGKAVTQRGADVVAIDIRNAYSTERAKLSALERAQMVRASQGLSATDTRALDQTMLGSLKIFKVYTADMARLLVDPHAGLQSFADALLGLEADAADEVEKIEATGSLEAYRFFLVGINTSDGSIACVQVALDIGGCPLVGKVDLIPYGSDGKTIGHSARAFGGSMYDFDPVWPGEADSIVRNVRCSIEIGAFYENRLRRTGSVRRLLAVLMSLAAESVMERQERASSAHSALRRDHLMALVYANGTGVPTTITYDFCYQTKPEDRVFKPSDPSKPNQLDYGQLGLRRMYTSLGLEPVAYASPYHPSVHTAPSRAHDVYSTRYLLVNEQMRSNVSRNAESLHVGSVDHVLQALGVRYGLEPIDVAAFRPLVKTLRDLHREGIKRIGRCPDHDPFTVIGDTAYAFGKRDILTNKYTFVPEAKYDENGVHRANKSLVQWLNLDYVVRPAAAPAAP